MVLMQHAIQIILDKLKLLSVRLFLLERVQQNGPSVNSSFKQKLEVWDEKYVGPLHIISNRFLEGLKEGINLDQIKLDVFGFFKYSAKYIQGYQCHIQG